MSYTAQQHTNAFSPWHKNLASLELSDKQLEDINNCLSIQGEHGNWDYDEYMHGMFNGMELMDSIIDSREPNFKESPRASLKLSWEEAPLTKKMLVYIQDVLDDLPFVNKDQAKPITDKMLSMLSVEQKVELYNFIYKMDNY